MQTCQVRCPECLALGWGLSHCILQNGNNETKELGVSRFSRSWFFMPAGRVPAASLWAANRINWEPLWGSLCVVTWSSLCVCVPILSSYKHPSPMQSRLTLQTSLYLNYLLNDPIFYYNHILSSWVRVSIYGFWGMQFSTPI